MNKSSYPSGDSIQGEMEEGEERTRRRQGGKGIYVSRKRKKNHVIGEGKFVCRENEGKKDLSMCAFFH